jgi:hypothetical protein
VLREGNACTVGACQCQHDCIASGTAHLCACQASWGECTNGRTCTNGICQ